MKQFKGDYQSSQKGCEVDVSQEVTNSKGKPQIPIISNEISDFFQKYETQILENRLSGIDKENYEQYENVQDERKEFRQAFESHLLDCKEKDLSKCQQLFSLIKQFFNNKINEEYIIQTINQWQSRRLTSLQISQIFDNFKLDKLIQTPELLNIIAKAIYHHQFHNQYEFYNSLIFEVIKHQNRVSNQQNRDEKELESLFENIELIAINLIIKKQNTVVLEELMHYYYSQPWIEALLKNKQIIDFLIARHFERWLSQLSLDQKNELNDEINVFKAIRDQSQLGMINFLEENFIGAIQYLKEIYCQSDICKMKLTKMIKASAIVNNFEQEAGNAMSVLSSLESIIRSQDFSKINLKNSTMNNIQFISTNFNGSRMNNVSIVSAQFIDCSLQNVNWQSLESLQLDILKGNSTLFSSHKSVLISMIGREERYLTIFNLCFYNFHTGKQIKTLYKQSENGFRNQSLKLSCLGQVIVFNDDMKSIFWSIQSQKKIRVNRGVIGEGKNVLSSDCKTLAQQNENYVSLWRIYNSKQQLQIQIKDIFEIQFSKKNQILILQGDGQSFWDCQSGQEIKTIQKERGKYKFSPDGLHYAIYQYQVTLRRIYDETYVEVLQGTDENFIFNLKFSPDGKILAFQDTKSIQLWTVEDSKVLQTIDYELTEQFSSIIKFSPDGQSLAFKQNNEIVLWVFNQGKQLTRIEGFNIKKIRFSPCGQYLMLKDYNFSKLWNLKNQQKCLNFQNNQLSLVPDRVSFSCCTSQLCFIYGCKDKKSKVIKIKILKDMKVISEIDFDKNSVFKSFTLSPDFLKIAFFNQKTVCIQKIEGGQPHGFQQFEDTKCQSPIKGEKQFKFSPDGEYLIIFRQSFLSRKTDWWSMQVWRIENQIQIYQTDVDNEEGYYNIDSFEFSNDSQNLAITCYGISILNIKSQVLNKLKLEEYYIPFTLSFSVEGNFLAYDSQEYDSNHYDGRVIICIMKINDGQSIQRLRGHNKKIIKIIFLNEDIIASASEDFTIKIWNRQLEQQIQVLNQHQYEINNLSISPDRSMMVSQDCKGTVYLWRNIETQNHNDQSKTENSFQEVTADNQSQNSKIKHFYVLHSVLSSPRFRSVNCPLNGSQFSSTEGFNLQNVFHGIENYIND